VKKKKKKKKKKDQTTNKQLLTFCMYTYKALPFLFFHPAPLLLQLQFIIHYYQSRIYICASFRFFFFNSQHAPVEPEPEPDLIVPFYLIYTYDSLLTST